MATGPTGYGKFCVDLARHLTSDMVQTLATYFEFSPADIDIINRASPRAIAFIRHMNNTGDLRENNITPLTDALRHIGLHGVAEEVQESFDQHVEVSRGPVDHAEYPYLTRQELTDFANDRKYLAIFNEKNKKECERRFKNYSLKSSRESKPEDRKNGVQHLRVMMVGKTGSGKSATANSLLGKKMFFEGETSVSQTVSSGIATSAISNGRQISVVDSPGLRDNREELLDEDTKHELGRVAYLLRDGVHAFVFVWNASETRLSDDASATIKVLKEEFGGKFLDYCSVVYSFAEGQLKKTSLDDFVVGQKKHPELRVFLDEIGWRIIAVDNGTDIPAEQRRNQTALVDLIDKMVSYNDGEVYENEVFVKARILHRRVEMGCRAHHPALVAASIELYNSSYVRSPNTEMLSERVMSILRKNKTGKLLGDGNVMELVDEQGQTNDIRRDEFMKQIISIREAIDKHITPEWLAFIGTIALGAIGIIAFCVMKR